MKVRMSFFRRCGATVLATLLALAWRASHAAAGEGFGAATPAVEGTEQGSNALRKPPVPSFLAHEDRGWIEFSFPPSARDRIGPLGELGDDLRAELAEDLGQAPLQGVEVRVA